ncbi:PAS and ANTAR domain-containing protein [Myceligenerans salitolerans]|uniref:histidine kinase n=1 Tax=Myceligenerans salitolerans TaxID=1230528 RepID=A0ABS3ICK1_9MICO|nr:PAS and ANTAR domain-containing protein [Myceligenerans salitolerans]MBO0610336.1 PAS and ANTAR domain-containing protein [Myceligenerans salitolerans]
MTAEPMQIERALAHGTHHVVGRYRYEIATQRWWWSDETFHIHGFEPGEVVPTTALVLAHKHPQDRERASRALDEAAATGDPFSSVHRIMDAHGRERTLAVVGQGRRDVATREVQELVGYFIDVTSSVKARASEAASASIRAAAATRAPIEQAKGIIAISLRIDPEEAFERLRSASNDTNVAVRDVARHIVEMATNQHGTMTDVVAALAPPARRSDHRSPATREPGDGDRAPRGRSADG